MSRGRHPRQLPPGLARPGRAAPAERAHGGGRSRRRRTTRHPTVGATNWAGGLGAVEHLIGLGHRRIGFITGAPALLCSRARLDGYRAGLEAAGIEVDDTLIREGDFYHQSGFDGGAALLELDEPPTAIFASSDQMAFGVYEAVRQRDRRVPGDISVVGCDDLPEARWASSPLTTVHQPLSAMGRLAARGVLRLAAGDEIGSPRVELATSLTVRESTTRLPGDWRAPGGEDRSDQANRV